MRTQMGTWKTPKSMENIAQRLENVLGWQEAEKNVYEEVVVKNGTVPQYVSPLGNDVKGTMLGRIIHERTNRPNRTWDERGQDALADHNKLRAEQEANQALLDKKWKTKDQELENIFERLSDI